MISVVIPTLNEPGIGTVIKEIKQALASKSYEIIVVDKSDDETPNIVNEAGANLYRQIGKGYGGALIEGMHYANGDIIVMLDGDRTYATDHIPKLLKIIESGKADLVVGNRFADMEKGAMPLINKIGNKILTYILNILFRTHLKDSQCGLRMFRKSIYENVKFNCRDMAFATEMIIIAKKRNIMMSNIPTSYYKREGNPKLIPFKHGFSILRSMIWYFLGFY